MDFGDVDLVQGFIDFVKSSLGVSEGEPVSHRLALVSRLVLSYRDYVAVYCIILYVKMALASRLVLSYRDYVAVYCIF